VGGRDGESARVGGVLVFEADEQLAQQRGELLAFRVGQRGQQDVLVGQVAGCDLVEQGGAGSGEGDQDPATVVAARSAGDHALGLEPSQPDAHRSRRQAEPRHQVALRQGVGRTGAPQRGDHREVGEGEVVAGEQGRQLLVHAGAHPGEPGEDLDRRHVQVGALGVPLGHDAVDGVGQPRAAAGRGLPRAAA
jgi:hypothetical protein